MSFEEETGRDIYFAQLNKELSELLDPETGMLSCKFYRKIPCPLCEEKENEKLFVRAGYTFVRCLDCGLVYVNPQVLPEIIHNTYHNDISSTELWMKVLLNQKDIDWRMDYFKDILAKIENHTQRGKILDVGCALGYFLKIAKDSGWETVGLELSQIGSKHAKEKFNLKVINKTVEEASFSPNTFDAISMIGVLEHLPNPLQLLRQCMRILKPEGVILVVVPNMYSLLNMVLRDKSLTFDGRNHLVHFSKDTLQKCFSLSGFEIVFNDTLLTGIHNLAKYIQFLDPHGNVDRTDFIPEVFRSLMANNGNRNNLEKFVLSNGLGLRLRMIGRKP